jgi:hypothetical protein
MDLTEMIDRLQAIARDDRVAASARVRALEVLLRINKQATPEDLEWEKLVQQFGPADAE